MLRIYDTRQRKKVELISREPGKIGIYVCGVTVYDLCHVGHARTLVAFDVVVRHLRRRGFSVRLVRNITDVDDKIIRRANSEGRSAAEVALTYTEAMLADAAALGVSPPDVEPRATQHVADDIAVIRRLEERGLAYPADGDVYYSVADFPSYGALSGQSIEDLQAGARIEIGEHKKSPLDFALWKAAKPGEPSWESPLGAGAPGLASGVLGHGSPLPRGGLRHPRGRLGSYSSPPRKRDCPVGGPGPFARHWMHSGMVNFGGEKMSKSLGNVVTIRKVAESHDLEALRLLLVSVHYRSPVSFTLARSSSGQAAYPELEEAEARLDYFYRTLERLDAFLAQVKPPASLPLSLLEEAAGSAMDDDFNTAAAIGHLYDAFVLANKLLDEPKAMPKPERQVTLAAIAHAARDPGAALGIMQRRPEQFLLARRERLCRQRNIDATAVEARLAERVAARRAKDFGRADAIRAEMRDQGVELMDTPAGTSWRVV